MALQIEAEGAMRKSVMESRKSFATVTIEGEKSFDFFRTLLDGVIAGGVVAGVVVETALYPIDTIKTRLQAGCSWWRSNSIKGTLFWIGWKYCWCLTGLCDICWCL